MPLAQSTRPLFRISAQKLTEYGASFTLKGLRFHFRKLAEYTNPTGGGLDKIPLNTMAWERLFKAQFEPSDERIVNPIDDWADSQPKTEPKPIFLRKKAQYHVANHLLGIGQVAYWTGSKGRSTLLGLDIDDHESGTAELIHKHSVEALDLFKELTGWKPLTCRSGRGIHGFLILDKGWLTAQATNELWHNIVRAVQAEAKKRGLIANLECKGKAKIITDNISYGGLLLKDPFLGMNPSDDDLKAFWTNLEERRLSDQNLWDTLVTLESLKPEITTIVHSFDVKPANDTAQPSSICTTHPSDQGTWAKKCLNWATHGLQQHDSMAEAVFELAKWLYFIELWDMEPNERYDKVVDLLQQFCLHKHNGYITRLNDHKPDEVLDHVERIVHSAFTRITESAKTCFANIRCKRSSGHYSNQWFLAPLLLSTCPLSSVKLIVCCTVSKKDEDKKICPEEWVFDIDTTPLPEQMEIIIRAGLKAKGAKEKTYRKIVGLLNYVRSNNGEVRLGIMSLKKMGFSNHASRQHIIMLRRMELLIVKEDYSPVLGLGKSFVLTAKARELFGMEDDEPEDGGS